MALVGFEGLIRLEVDKGVKLLYRTEGLFSSKVLNRLNPPSSSLAHYIPTLANLTRR